MMPRAWQKRLAQRVMALAVLIAPSSTREWALAMSAELEHVGGAWRTLSWALGCFGTVFRQLCFSVFSRGNLIDVREAAMSKFAKISALIAILGSALFLLAPQFRQALHVTAASWRQSDSAWLSQMRALGAKAEADHDAEALAFAAMHLRYDSKNRLQRDKFADLAVQWEPGLTWIYFALFSADVMSSPRNPDPNDDRWVNSLQAWDPRNAAPYALKAASSRPSNVFGWNSQANRALLAGSPEWLHDMDQVFASSTYDSYGARLADLERRVTQRHRLQEPRHILLDFAEYPVPELGNFLFYEKYFLLPAARDFEAKGDLSGAERTYEKVAHLGQVIELGAYADIERIVGVALQQSADAHLEAIFEKNGNAMAANLVAFQIASGQQANDLIRANCFGQEAELDRVNAFLLQFSLIAIALSLVLIIWSCAYLAGRRLLARGHSTRTTALFARTGITAAAVLLASVMVMYFAYSPYATAFQSYLAASNPRDMHQSLLRFEILYELPSSFFYNFQQIYLWYTVVAAGGATIAWIVYRHIARTFRTPAQPAA